MNYLTQTLAALAAAAVLAACGNGDTESVALAAVLPAPSVTDGLPLLTGTQALTLAGCLRAAA